MGNASHMDRVWPWITNTDMLAISHAWAGHPGTLVRAYPSVGLPVGMAVLGDCSGSPGAGFKGWMLKNGSLIAPPAADTPPSSSAATRTERHGGTQAQAQVPAQGQQCMVGIQHSGVVNENAFTCPPATTANKQAPMCGSMLFNCSAVSGFWAHKTTGELAWAQHPGDTKTEKCLVVTAGVVSSDRNGSKADPKAGSMAFTPCVTDGKTAAPSATFTLSADGTLKVGTPAGSSTRSNGSSCIGVGDAPGLQLWAKPMATNRVAFLVLNPLPIPQTLTLPLSDIPGNPCSKPLSEQRQGAAGRNGACTLRDVWAGKDEPMSSPTLAVSLQPHESAVWILSAGAAAV